MTPGGTQSDPGLAAERTALAWSRSSVAILAVAGSVAKSGITAGGAVVGLAGAAALVILSAIVWWAGSRSYTRLDGQGAGDPLQRRRSLRVITAASVLTPVLALAILLGA